MLVMTNKLIVKTENNRKIEPNIADWIWAPSAIVSAPINNDIKKSSAMPIKINTLSLSRMASQTEYFDIENKRLLFINFKLSFYPCNLR